MSQQRVALVTGGMGGLGEAVCERLARSEYKVVTTYSPSNEHTAAWLSKESSEGFVFSAYKIDVADFESCVAGVASIIEDAGPVDILINNAGITRDASFRKMSKADWDVVLHTDLDSIFNMTKQVVEGMVSQVPADIMAGKILPQIPVGRLGKPEEVAGLIAYLVSEEAAFITGANIAINGGQHMS
jgi:NAD(P)-dependent dehydrogenase (short-subunit alcohol dehydrogenase family)